MKILALETSTEYCSVALWQDGSVIERSELVGQKHSELLIEMIDAVLQCAGLKVQDVSGLGFGKGPGSFTGVRIACGVAQGLALGADLKVVGVCTLEALAQASGHNKVIAALDARMNEIYLAAYEKCAEGWTVVIEPCLCKAEAAPFLEGDSWFGVGSGFAESLKSHYEKQLSGVDAGVAPQASAIAQLAAIEFAKGKAVDAALALPLYLRDKVALTTSERGGK
ncbi:MAG: tRNA (adenosine(37)-N6)-threonylcarbamoyltransferase complex dimerization subunit type 1 TsaB [Gallionellaceae bacterium]|nr:tRNA (adenosine(37)-N6)-threonylcarbamoyltransferase complex dimerization subunit type 1 TsaB [Gallionellaceae bacterium]